MFKVRDAEAQRKIDHLERDVADLQTALRLYGGDSRRLARIERALALLLERAGQKRPCTPADDQTMIYAAFLEKDGE